MFYMYYNYFFLALIFFLGFFIVKDDIKFRKIRNKYILLGFIAGVFLYFAGFIAGITAVDYLLKVAVNSLIALAVGFFIWRLNFWPAGDAKLFFLLSFLLPLKYYYNSYLPYFPSFVLLFNSFICALFVILPVLVSGVLKELKRTFVKNSQTESEIFLQSEPSRTLNGQKTNRLQIAFLIILDVWREKISERLPFSPFFFAGAVFALILKGWVMFWLR